MKIIPLTRGQITKIDDDDLQELSEHKWFCGVQPSGLKYACRRERGSRKFIYMHRQILQAPIGFQVDHRDGYGLNNQRFNIRICWNGENPQNIGIPKHNTSGWLGVSWKADNDKWQASIKVNGKSRYLGYFLDPVEAALAYDAAAVLYHGDFATTNF